jgi:hypothetical protein
MKSNPNQDRLIKVIFFSDELGSSIPFPGTLNRTARLVSEFHGDHDEDWVLVFDASGAEVERWNARMLAGIEWDGVSS